MPEKSPKTVSSRRTSLILNILLGVFITAFIVSTIMLIMYFINSKAEADKYTENPNLNSLSSLFAPGYLTDPTEPIDNIFDKTDPVSGDNSTSSPDTDADTVPGTDADSDADTGSVAPENTADPSTTAPIVTEAPNYSARFLAVRENILALQKINPDIVGYISIPTLGISYPLLHRPSDTANAYYLTHSYDHSPARSGSIYMDYRCFSNLSTNYNTVIYGHNMRDDSMFGKLERCANSRKAFDEAIITIATLDAIYTYKMFSTYRTTADVNYIRTNFDSQAELTAFCQEVADKSIYDSGIKSFGTSILTLSTCTNLNVDGRYAFHAVLIRTET